jgi:NTE family protein
MIRLFCILILVSHNLTQLYSQQKEINRPKIGLVLSGGGAKGMAHIGVLKVLEKNKIPIDYITGTSMGSIIGALYAIGFSAQNIEEIAKSMNWGEIFDGSTARRYIAIEEKDLEGKFILEIPMVKGKPVIPTGVISAQKLEMELANITWSVHGIRDFSKFPIPFACIATDIETGEAIVFKEGYLPDVLRASMAIPSVFTAVEINNKLLVDGGLVRNFPVSDAREMGADFIIGVDVAAPLYKKEEMTSMLKIMEQAASFPNDKSNEQETKLVDILIKPDITGYDASSFDASEILIRRGETAALAVEGQLVELKKKLEGLYDTSWHDRSPPLLHSIFLSKIRFEGLIKVSESMVRNKLSLNESSWVTLRDIEKGVARLYGTRYFEKVNYRIEINDNKTELIVRLSEQAFSLYKVGLNFNNILNANVLINATYRNVLGEGSRLVLSSKLGSMPEFFADYTIFTNLKPSIGFTARAEYFNLRETVFGYNDSLNLEISNNTFLFKLGLASSLSNSSLVSIGAEVYYKSFSQKRINHEVAIPERTGIKAFAQYKLDNSDRNIYPNYGAILGIDVNYTIDELIKTTNSFDKSFWQMVVNYEQYFPIGKHFNYKHFFRTGISLSEKLFYNDQYFIGGEMHIKNYIFPMSGYPFMHKKSNQFVMAGFGMRYEPWQGKFILFDLNTGISENEVDNILKPEMLYFGGTVGFGIRTIIGPVEYRIGTNHTDRKLYHWFQIGYSF